MYIIYKHTLMLDCPSKGKSYIGYTKYNNPNIRWQNGKGYCKQTQPCFRDAIKKYGWDNFSHEILETTLTQEQAKIKEKYWIAFYHTYVKDSFSWGYNLTPGGDDHTYNSYKCYQLLEDKTIVTKFNSLLLAEDATNISAKNIYKACTHKINSAGGYYWCYEQDYSSYVIKRSKKLHATRAVYKLLSNKDIVGYFNTVTDAANSVNGASSKISLCCSGKRQTAYGFYWCYANDYPTYQIVKHATNIKRTAVIQLDLNYNYIAEFDSITAAEAKYHTSNITRACKDTTHKKTVAGYHWMYQDEYELWRLNYEKRESEN